MKRIVGTVLRPYFMVLYTIDNGPQNSSIIEYPTVYDRLHTAKYSACQTSEILSKRVVYGRAYLTWKLVAYHKLYAI
jgi:hypothetical protein